VARYLLDGDNAAMISIPTEQFIPILFNRLMPPETGRAKIRVVDIGSTRYRIARRYSRDAFQNPHELAKFAAATGISLEDFRDEFKSLVQLEPPPLTRDLTRGCLTNPG
jgi:hypothetical protein